MFCKKVIIEKFPHVEDTFVPARVCVVDNYLNNDWNYNDAGWLRNDLSALAAAQTKQQYELILQHMRQMPTDLGIPKGTTIEQAFNMIKPRYCQTENEFVDFAGFLTEKGLKNIEAAYEVERLKKQSSETPESDVKSE